MSQNAGSLKPNVDIQGGVLCSVVQKKVADCGIVKWSVFCLGHNCVE